MARHEPVVVVNRERPVYVILSAEDHSAASTSPSRGRALNDALAMLAIAPLPDPSFADDLEQVRALVGPNSDDPWAHS